MVLPSSESPSTKGFNHSSGFCHLSHSCALFTIHVPSGYSRFPADFSARSCLCHPLLAVFPASLALPAAVHVLPGVMQVWRVKPSEFCCEAERCLISTGNFQPRCLVCVSYLERKALSWKCVETQKQHLVGGAKLCFALFASPSCSLDCCAPDCLFPGSGFFLDKPYSPLHHGIASVSVSALTLQQTTSFPRWDPVYCSPVPPDCLQGCSFRPLKNFW